jgi:hypothetical protein
MFEANKSTYALACAFATATASAGVAWLLYRPPRVHNEHGQSPPGPKRRPIVGNVGNFPTVGWLDEFTKLQKEYGKEISLYPNIIASNNLYWIL